MAVGFRGFGDFAKFDGYFEVFAAGEGGAALGIGR